MTPELTVLTLAALLQVVQFALVAVPANRELDSYPMSSRDTPPPQPLSLRTARLQRAMSNHFEGLILFTIACVVIAISNQSTGFTATCAWVYLGARILYVPAYAMAINPARSIIWGVGFLATFLMLIAALV